MISAICADVQTRLEALGCHFPVVDGPEDTDTIGFTRERVVVEYDDGGSDRFSPPTNPNAQGRKKRMFFVRTMALKVTVIAQSPKKGALYLEHRRRCEHVVDLVLVAFAEVADDRKNQFVPLAGRPWTPKDQEKGATTAGYGYAFTCTFDRGVFKTTFKGEERPTAALAGINSTTKVSSANVPDDDDDPLNIPAAAETACGDGE